MACAVGTRRRCVLPPPADQRQAGRRGQDTPSACSDRTEHRADLPICDLVPRVPTCRWSVGGACKGPAPEHPMRRPGAGTSPHNLLPPVLEGKGVLGKAGAVGGTRDTKWCHWESA